MAEEVKEKSISIAIRESLYRRLKEKKAEIEQLEGQKITFSELLLRLLSQGHQEVVVSIQDLIDNEEFDEKARFKEALKRAVRLCPFIHLVDFDKLWELCKMMARNPEYKLKISRDDIEVQFWEE